MRRYGLIGKKLEHSFSGKYFTSKFKREKIADCSYQSFPLNSIAELPGLFQKYPDLAGLNVTIPYKVAVIPYLDRLDKVAADVGAVNTIKVIRSENKMILEGYNTDVPGFINSLDNPDRFNRVLILGTGGAAMAVAYALNQMGIETLFVSRTKTADNVITYFDLDKETIQKHLLIIQATPAGMYPNVDSKPEIPYKYLTEKHFLYDLVYNPAETLFLKMGRELGAETM
nr:shikimate dehydrogenase [Bacteroidota bacterium]